MAEISPARKRLALLVVVIGSVLIVERLFAFGSDDLDVVAPARPARSAATEPVLQRAPESSGGLLRLDRLDARQRALAERGDTAARRAEPFDAVSWQAPPAKAPPPPPPPRPVAPPFTYAYLGGLTEDGVRTAFFTSGDRLIAVKRGDTIDGAYRIDQMTDMQMQLTYLPLNERLIVALGAAR